MAGLHYFFNDGGGSGVSRVTKHLKVENKGGTARLLRPHTFNCLPAARKVACSNPFEECLVSFLLRHLPIHQTVIGPEEDLEEKKKLEEFKKLMMR